MGANKTKTQRNEKVEQEKLSNKTNLVHNTSYIATKLQDKKNKSMTTENDGPRSSRLASSRRACLKPEYFSGLILLLLKATILQVAWSWRIAVITP